MDSDLVARLVERSAIEIDSNETCPSSLHAHQQYPYRQEQLGHMNAFVSHGSIVPPPIKTFERLYYGSPTTNSFFSSEFFLLNQFTAPITRRRAKLFRTMAKRPFCDWTKLAQTFFDPWILLYSLKSPNIPRPVARICDALTNNPLLLCEADEPWTQFIRQTMIESNHATQQPLFTNRPFVKQAWNVHTVASCSSITANATREDTHTLARDPISKCLIAQVIDGHGGTLCPFTMTEWIPRLVMARLHYLTREKRLYKNTAALALQGAFIEADARFLDKITLMKEQGSHDPLIIDGAAASGACCLTAIIGPDFCTIASVGDCRALLITQSFLDDKRTSSHWLTEPHNPYCKREYDNLFTMTKGRDKMPARPSLFQVAASSSIVPSSEALARCQSWIDSMTEPVSFEEQDDALRALGQLVAAPVGKVPSMMLRTAGHLAVTRALGDAFLKVPQLAPSTIDVSYPYVHAMPSITTIERSLDERAILVMASDGVWDFLDKETMMKLILEMEADLVDGMPFGMCESILRDCLDQAAEDAKMDLKELLSLPPGKQRRAIHDDMTLMILWLGHAPKMIQMCQGIWKTQLVTLS